MSIGPKPSVLDGLAETGSEVTVGVLPADYEQGMVRMHTIILKNEGDGSVSERPGDDWLFTPPSFATIAPGVPLRNSPLGTEEKNGPVVGSGAMAGPGPAANPAESSSLIAGLDNGMLTDDQFEALVVQLEGTDTVLSSGVSLIGVKRTDLDYAGIRRHLYADFGLLPCGKCNTWFVQSGGNRAKCGSCD